MRRMFVTCCCCIILLSAAAQAVGNPGAEASGLVKISFYDGTEYFLSDFSFYTSHEGVTGTYVKSTINQAQPLLVTTGRLWHAVRGEDIATIRLEPEPGKKQLKTLIALKGGGTVNGRTPLEISTTWHSGDYFWIQGLTTKFGRPAKFRVKLEDVALVDAVRETPGQFIIKTRKGDEKTVQALEFGLYGSMPYASPAVIGLRGTVKLSADSLEVDVPLHDVQSFTFDRYGEMTVIMRSGETGKAAFIDIRRIYGKLKTGDVLFENVPSSEGDPIKSIEFPRPALATRATETAPAR